MEKMVGQARDNLTPVFPYRKGRARHSSLYSSKLVKKTRGARLSGEATFPLRRRAQHPLNQAGKKAQRNLDSQKKGPESAAEALFREIGENDLCHTKKIVAKYQAHVEPRKKVKVVGLANARGAKRKLKSSVVSVKAPPGREKVSMTPSKKFPAGCMRSWGKCTHAVKLGSAAA